MPVGIQKARWRQVAASCEQTFGLVESLIHRRKWFARRGLEYRDANHVGIISLGVAARIG